MSEFKSQFEKTATSPLKLAHCPYCGSDVPLCGNTQHTTWCVQNALTTQWPLDDQPQEKKNEATS